MVVAKYNDHYVLPRYILQKGQAPLDSPVHCSSISLRDFLQCPIYEKSMSHVFPMIVPNHDHIMSHTFPIIFPYHVTYHAPIMLHDFPL